MADRFSHLADSTSSPSRSMFSVTPHDGNPLPTLPKALYVGQGGDIVLRCIDDGADVTFRVSVRPRACCGIAVRC